MAVTILKVEPGAIASWCCPAVERGGFIHVQLRKIVGIHLVRKPVIIIPRIGHTCKCFSGIWIGEYKGAGAWSQRKLGRTDLKIINLLTDKLAVIDGTGRQSVVCIGIHLKNTLIKKKHTDIITIEALLFEHIAVYLFTEIIVIIKVAGNVIGKSREYLFGIHVFRSVCDLRDINPVLGDRISQEFFQTDGFLFCPLFIDRIGLSIASSLSMPVSFISISLTM